MEQSGKGTSVIINKYGKEVFHFGTSYIECIFPFNITDKNKYYMMIGKINVPVNVGVKLELKNVDYQILELLMSNASLTIVKLSLLLNVPTRTIERKIKSLKNKGLLQRIGSDKNGYWKVVILNEDRK